MAIFVRKGDGCGRSEGAGCWNGRWVEGKGSLKERRERIARKVFFRHRRGSLDAVSK